MTGIQKYIKPSVLGLAPYSSARDEHSGHDGIFLDANENPYDLSYSRYPDPYQTALRKKIGDWRGVEIENIFVGNGSDEVIDLLISATCVSGLHRILTLDPSYGMYRVSAAINEVEIDLVPLNDDFTIDMFELANSIREDHRLIFICSPNNPNGALVTEDVIRYTLESSNAIVVIDEAYIDFADRASCIGLLSEYDNLVVLQTFSKALGAAGIRVGMGYMHPDLRTVLNKIKPPYNVSTSSQELALQRLNDWDEVNKLIDSIVASRERLSIALAQLSIVEKVFPSDANFLLVRFADHKIVMRSLRERHIIVRDRSSQTHCHRCLRLTIGTEEENQTLINVLREIRS